MHFFRWGACFLISGCVARTTLPEGVQVKCDTDDDCQKPSVCSRTLFVCIENAQNQAPSLTLAPIARSTSVIEIPIVVTDAESDEVAVGVRLLPGDAVIATPATVQGNAQGAAATLQWDAAAYFGDQRFRGGLRLGVTPVDGANRGVEVISEAFDFGNDAPELVRVEVETDAGNVARGSVIVRVEVRDNLNDELSLTSLELSLIGDFSDAVAVTAEAEGGGGGEGLAYRFRWNSSQDANVVAPGARLRARMQDAFGALTEAVESPAFAIDNSPVATAMLATPEGARFINAVSITFTAGDPGSEAVQVELAYLVGNVRYPATVAPGSPAGMVVWDALADAQAGKGLAQASVPVSADEAQTAATVRYTEDIELSLTPIDARGLRGMPVALLLDALGNDVPSASLAPFMATERGIIPIDFTLSDLASDEASVDLQFRVHDGPSGTTGPWRTMDIAQGVSEELTTAPSGREHLVTWSSTAARLGDPNLPQGVGKTSEANVEVRARASDAPGSGTRYFGAWSAAQTIGAVVNQSPPRIEGLVARRADALAGSAPVAIAYTLIDEESDPASLSCEYSFDFGTSWQPCVEYRSARSEGSAGLATLPSGAGGVRHTFVWDVAGTQLLPALSSRVRLRADDGKGPPAPPSVLPLPLPAGPIATSPNGAPFATPSAISGATLWARNFVVRDLNGDGALDIAAALFASSTVRVLLGNETSGVPDGTFTDKGGFGSAAPTHMVVGADFDRDGALDLATIGTSGATGGVTVLHATKVGQSGDGTFTATQTLAVAFQSAALAAGDIDGVNGDDIAAANGSSVSVFTNDGAGTLALANSYALDDSTNGVAVGDFDGDDLADVVAVSSVGTVHIWHATGSGTLMTPPTTIASLQSFNNNGGPIMLGTDLNADGLMDVALLHQNNLNALSLFVADGAGGFQPEIVVAAADGNASALGQGDVNGDGITDLFATDFEFARINVFLGTSGDSLLAPFFSLSNTGVSSQVTCGDFNGDARPDLVLGATANSIRLALASPRVTADEQLMLRSTQNASGNPNGIVTLDVDGDGAREFVVMNGGASQLTLFIADTADGEGLGTFSLAGPSAVTGVVTDALPASGDFNEDGFEDVAVPLETQASIKIFLAGVAQGAPTRTLVPGDTFAVESDPKAVLVRDFNEDGHQDLAVANQGSSSISFLLGAGDGTFSLLNHHAVSCAVWALAAADVDGDGALDVVGNCGSGVVILYGVSGMPWTFGFAQTLTGNGFVDSVVTADLDTDGNTDIIVFSESVPVDNDLEVFRGTGPGGPHIATFAPRAEYDARNAVNDTATRGRFSVVLSDLTQDGVLDAVVANSYLPTGGNPPVLSIFPGLSAAGLGLGTFAARHDLVVPELAQAIAAADFNSDGVLDYATSALSAGATRVYMGRRDGVARTAFVPFSDAGSAQLFGIADADAGDAGINLQVEPEVLPPLAESSAVPNGRLIPFTAAWRASGDVRLARVDTGGSRLRIENRLGARQQPGSEVDFDRAGLDLDAVPPRGVILELPILAARADNEITDASARHIFVRTVDYRRAGTGDPRLLPQGPFGDLLQEVVSITPVQQTLDHTFATGNGPRFYLDLDDPTRRRVRILLEKLGVVQAFFIP